MNTVIQTLAVIPFSILSILGSEEYPDLLSPLSGENVLAQRQMSLENRYENSFVNGVFKDNILLTLAYMRGEKGDPASPFTYQFTLQPNSTFAFHDDVEAKYKDSLVKTTNAHFNAQEGFKTDGYLYGDGVCHLASLIYWAAKDAKLDAKSPVNHNFAKIPGVPKEYGVSIYSNPYSKGSNSQQNLYITNNKSNKITFKFEYQDNKVKVSVLELN